MLGKKDAKLPILNQTLWRTISMPFILSFLLNLFPILRNKSQNTNYQNIWSQFVKFSSIYSYDSYEHFIKALLNKHPEYTKLICDCLPTHLNKTYGINLIKSIIDLINYIYSSSIPFHLICLADFI